MNIGEIKQVYIPIVKVTFSYTYVDDDEIKITNAGEHKFPIKKLFDGSTYDLFKYNGTVAVYKRTEKKKNYYFAWGISNRDSKYDKSIGEQVHTYEWAEPVKISGATRDYIEDISPLKKGFENINAKLWDYYSFTTFKPDLWITKLHQYQDRIRIKEEQDYQKKQEKYARENRAQCGACERYIERWDEGNWDGVIYDHGFQQVGHRVGVCVGARYQPWEKSPEGKIAYIKDLESQKDWLLNNKPDEKLLAKLKKSVEIYVSFKKMLKELYEVNKKEYEESVRYFDRSDDDFIRWIRIYHNVNIEIQYPVNYLHSLHVWKETQLSELLNVWQAKVDLLTHLIINEQDKVDNWKAQLTPKEKRDASN